MKSPVLAALLLALSIPYLGGSSAQSNPAPSPITDLPPVTNATPVSPPVAPSAAAPSASSPAPTASAPAASGSASAAPTASASAPASASPSASSSAPAPSSSAAPATNGTQGCANVCHRQEIRTLSTSQRTAFFNAIKQLNSGAKPT
ncbi:hypothetical protein BJ684DRAFT_17473, partial [Piptocephalis cylindrospora]